jgi:membrane-bound metal-dependent hydrolase YbcI (DUF457 family)
LFIGHFGVGFGAKAVAPGVSLGSLFLASQFIDLLWPILLLNGVEQVRIEPGITRVTPLDFVHYPISHSLLAVIGWAGLFAAVYLFLRRSRRGAVVLGLAVVSHWLLDLVVHRPDLPLYPGSTDLFGLGLWSSVGATLAVELPIFLAGLWLYLRATEASDAVGRWALWGLVGFLIAIYFSNLYGAPPPNVTVLAWVGQAQWLLIAWGYWVDQHRRLVAPGNLSREAGNA